ncbi:MAG: glycosyltransferase family 39 protein [Acidobacteriota bacterium]
MRRDRWLIFLALAVVARLIFLFAVAHPEARSGAIELRFDTDEADYHNLATNLATSGRYALSPDGPATAIRPPGTVLPIAALYRVFGPSPVLGIALVFLASLAIVAVVGALASEIAPSSIVPQAAMLIAALMPTLVFTAAGIWSDTLGVLFSLLALLLLLRARRSEAPWRHITLAAASLGVAYLNRPSVILLIVLVTALLAVEHWPRRALRVAALFAAVSAVPIAAWGFWNQATLGRFFIGNTQSTVTLLQANNPVTAGKALPALREANGYDLHAEAAAGHYRGSWIPLAYIARSNPWSERSLPEMEAETWLRKQATGFMRDDPAAFARLLTYKALRIFTAEPTAPSVLAEGPTKRRLKRLVTLAERWFVLLLGTFGSVLMWRQDRSATLYFLLFVAAGLAVVFVAYPNARILLPVSTTLIVPAAMAVVWLVDKARVVDSN